jgi:hypothetical protein
MRGSSALALFGFLAACFASAYGCGTKQGACVFDDICSQGSSYEGPGGLCEENGGAWNPDGCPAEKCLGKCDHGSYWVYYYMPAFNGIGAAKAKCFYLDSHATWEDGCYGVMPKVPSWFTTPCSEMGGTTIASGACYVPCADPCPVEQLGCGYGYQNYCRVLSCSTTADCGPNPDAWVCGNGCFMKCATDSGGAQSPECPSDGFACTGTNCVHHISSTATCGEPCPKGCCSSTGLSCCQPPFCSGACAGSPCC